MTDYTIEDFSAFLDSIPTEFIIYSLLFLLIGFFFPAKTGDPK